MSLKDKLKNAKPTPFFDDDVVDGWVNWLETHDANVRADAIEEYRKEMHDMIDGNEEFTDWQKYIILECNELVAEQLRENEDAYYNAIEIVKRGGKG